MSASELSQYPIFFGAVVACTVFAWFAMIFLPRWEYTYKLLEGPLVLLPHLAFYVFLFVPQLPQQLSGLLANAFSVEGALQVVLGGLTATASPALLALHVLTFNLFVGKWVWLRRRGDNLSDLFCSLVLLSIMVGGPLGLAKPSPGDTLAVTTVLIALIDTKTIVREC
ncbi:hypothetical protein QOT17_002124 [Balamuthia mandrillaris]